jgi:hypothetical protein
MIKEGKLFMKAKFLFILLVLSLVLSIPFTSFAKETVETDSTKKEQKIFEKLLKKESKENKIVITDQKELEKIAKKEGMIKTPVRIEYEYVENESETSDGDESGEFNIQWHDTYEVKNVKDYGHGWYNSSDDLYRRFTVDGPDTFVISKTEKYTTYASANFGASNSVISAGVNFSIGTEESVTFTSNTPVDRGETLVAELFTTYHKKSYQVYKNGSYQGSGWAYRATGTYIKKTFY